MSQMDFWTKVCGLNADFSNEMQLISLRRGTLKVSADRQYFIQQGIYLIMEPF